MVVSFQRKRLWLNNYDNLQLLVEKFTLHDLSAPHKHGILELKKNYAHVIHGPTKRNQGAM